MKLAYQNKVFDYIISATSEQPNQPVENLQDTRLSRKWQSVTDGTNYITLSDKFTADCVIVKDHNIATSDTVTLEGSTVSDFASIAASESVTVLSGGFASFFTSAEYYWRLKIVSSDVVYIGGLYIGESEDLPAYDLTSTTKYVTTDKDSISLSGQLYGDKNYNYRSASFIFPWVIRGIDDVMLIDLWTTHTILKPFYVVQFPDNITNYPVWYCKLDQSSIDFADDPANIKIYSNTGFKIREVF